MKVTRKTKEKYLSSSHNPIHPSINDDEAIVNGLDFALSATNSKLARRSQRIARSAFTNKSQSTRPQPRHRQKILQRCSALQHLPWRPPPTPQIPRSPTTPSTTMLSRITPKPLPTHPCHNPSSATSTKNARTASGNEEKNSNHG